MSSHVHLDQGKIQLVSMTNIPSPSQTCFLLLTNMYLFFSLTKQIKFHLDIRQGFEGIILLFLMYDTKNNFGGPEITTTNLLIYSIHRYAIS